MPPFLSFPVVVAAPLRMNPSSSAYAARWTALAAVVFALSWLLPNHHQPWVDFYADAWAGLTLCVLAAVVLWRGRASGAMPWHLLPVLALACTAVVWLQYAAGLVESFGVAWTGALYLLGLVLALLVGAVWQRWRPGQCADFLFLAALVGATGSLLIQLQQWLRIDPGPLFWMFIPPPPSRMHANLGQPNQLSTLLCLGVLACAWLHGRGRLPGWLAWGWAVLLAGGLALTESRTGWAIVGVALGALLLWRRQLSIARPLVTAAFAWAAVFALCVLALPHVNLWLGHAQELQSLRGLSTLHLRLEFWARAWEALLRQPWTGYGWTQASLAQFTPDPAQMVTGGSLRHTHNLALDLLVELGLPLGLTVCALLALWAVSATRRVKTTEQLWMLLFVAALVVHALLEFPLHYAYFLLPAGLMLGALNVALGFRPLWTGRHWPAGLALGVAAAGLAVTAHDYLRIEDDFFALRFEQQRLARPAHQSAPPVMVLTHLQDAVWLARIDPGRFHSEQDIERAGRTTMLLPSMMSKYKLASMYALAGQPERAQYWLAVMVRMNRLDERAVRALQAQWEAQAVQYPLMALVRWP